MFMRWVRWVSVCGALVLVADAMAAPSGDELVIPAVQEESKRPITIEDMAALRSIESLSLSPDRRRFAIFVRQGDPAENRYRASWFVGDTAGGSLVRIGDGGETQVAVPPFGHVGGELELQQSRWSPDGQWLAYTLRRRGEVQLWRSRLDGSVQEQLTNNAGDVRDFAWSDDGKAIYFRTHTSRAELAAEFEAKSLAGLNYDEDLFDIHDFMLPVWRRVWAKNPPLWVFEVAQRRERRATEPERAAFEKAQARVEGGLVDREGFLNSEIVAPVDRSDGARAALVRLSSFSQHFRVTASLPSAGAKPIVCHAEECAGPILQVWWGSSGDHVVFWRKAGLNEELHRFYAWSPTTNEIVVLFQGADDELRDCTPSDAGLMICVRETKTRPVHLAAIDTNVGSKQLGAVRTIADVNPEFRNIRLGRVERFEWDTPRLSWNEPGGKLAGLYPKRAYGYIFYPPDFDATSKYPVFVEPYHARGFNSSMGNEHLLHVYAANDFVVLNMEYPWPIDEGDRFGSELNKLYFSSELDFPDLSMLAQSTLRGMDVAIGRGFINERLVGIGGVSTGTTVPLYIMQTQDRIAAISISGPGWHEDEYYWGSRKEREVLRELYGDMGYEDWKPMPTCEGRKFWSRIDIAQNIETVEAPILMHLAAKESAGVVKLIRHLAEAQKPYDAYVFPQETHLKWQPAHLRAIWVRNLDWFRFWLQGREDRDPAKSNEYRRWRKLRDMHETSRQSVLKRDEVSIRN